MVIFSQFLAKKGMCISILKAICLPRLINEEKWNFVTGSTTRHKPTDEPNEYHGNNNEVSLGSHIQSQPTFSN